MLQSFNIAFHSSIPKQLVPDIGQLWNRKLFNASLQVRKNLAGYCAIIINQVSPKPQAINHRAEGSSSIRSPEVSSKLDGGTVECSKDQDAHLLFEGM